MSAKMFAAALLLSVSALPGLASAHDVEISNAFIRVPPKSAIAGAGFMTIRNSCDHNDTLLSAEADISKTTELHTHVHEGDVMRMRKVESIALPASGEAKLQPGGDHIMFIGLTRQLAEGDVVPVTLNFSHAGKVTVNVPVVGIGASAAPAGQTPTQSHSEHSHH